MWDLLFNLVDDMFFAAIPAVGFGLLFNVPVRALKYCAMLGAMGHGFRMLLVHFHIPLVFATFFGAALIGFSGIYLSRRYLAHPKVFTVAAVIPMIPGVYAYKAMLSIVQIHHYGFSPELFQQMVEHFITATLLIGALAFGLALPGMLFYRRKPVI